MSHEYMLYKLLLQGQLVSSSRCTTCNFIVKDTGTRRLDPPFSRLTPLFPQSWITHIQGKKNYFVKFNFVEKGGSQPGKGGPDTRIFLYCALTIFCYHRPLRNLCVTNDHCYAPLVVSAYRFFPHAWLINGFVTRVARRVPLVEQELLTLTRI